MHSRLFKRRRYGYGWTPVTVGGWLITTAFIAVIVLWSLIMLPFSREVTTEQGLVYTAGLLGIIALMWLVIRKFAPPGKWRWGRKPTDNPNDDF